MNKRNLLLITLLLLLVVVTNWLGEQGVKTVDTRAVQPKPEQQTYYLSGFSVSSMDKKGQLQHKLTAEHLKHFGGSGKTTLEQPHMTLFEEQKVGWQLSADHGLILEHEDEVSLQGNVHITQAVAEPLHINTSALRIQPRQGYAETDQAVTMTQAQHKIDAVGMEIYQKEQRLLLLSQVRGHYEEPTR